MQSEKLKLLGFDESMRGVRYMDSALKIIESGHEIKMGQLYNTLSSEYCTSQENIGAGIRYAIQKWWRKVPDETRHKHFKICYHLGIPPTNKEFLTYIANENVSVFREE